MYKRLCPSPGQKCLLRPTKARSQGLPFSSLSNFSYLTPTAIHIASYPPAQGPNEALIALLLWLMTPPPQELSNDIKARIPVNSQS